MILKKNKKKNKKNAKFAHIATEQTLALTNVMAEVAPIVLEDM